MQSKNKRQPTARERDHLSRVSALPCSVCGAPPPSEVHEPRQGSWWLSVALCADCHRGGVNGLHGQRRMWAVHKVDELDALAVTISRLMP